MRIVIADDEVLLREGLERLLTEAGFEVVGKVGTRRGAAPQGRAHRPDVAIVDIKMPPTHTDEGLVAAEEIRESTPRSACSCSPTTSSRATRMRLLEQHPGGTGYLLKERVSDVAVLTDALRRLRDGECVLDPTIVARLVDRPRAGRTARRADRRASARCSPDRRGPLQRRHLRAPLPQPEDGRVARQPDLHEARARRIAGRSPPRARRARLPAALTGAAGLRDRARPPAAGSGR